MTTIQSVLQTRAYPGRGCLAARTSEGELVFVYFVTGRSRASKNRVLSATPSGDITVRDRGDAQHDALRHYCAAASRGAWTVVGNGDQVEPIAVDPGPQRPVVLPRTPLAGCSLSARVVH